MRESVVSDICIYADLFADETFIHMASYLFTPDHKKFNPKIFSLLFTIGVIPFQGSASFPLSLPKTENRFRSIFQLDCSFKRCQLCEGREYSILED